MKLLAERLSALVDELFIPARGRGETSGKDADEIGAVQRRGAVEQAESGEPDALDRHNVANTTAGLKSELASDHQRLFGEVELGHKGRRLGGGRIPVPDWGGW